MAANELFKKLLGFRWGVLSFPVSEMKLSVTQDLHEHKYWGVAGARVESTGRAALVFDAVIPFRNNIFPGTGEKWSPEVLYPNGFRAFVRAMSAGVTNTLVHPEFGPVKCKAKSCNVQWTGAKQDGVDVTAQWIETVVDAPADAAPAALGSQYVGADLDGALSSAQLKKLAPKLPTYRPDLDATLRSILAVGDQVSLLQKRAVGRLDHLSYQVGQIQTAVDGARNALTWPVGKAATHVSNQLARTRTALATGDRSLVLYAVPRDTTLGALAAALEVPVQVLVTVNPHLVRSPMVRAGSPVKYYLSTR